jgi:superfamily II DNA or RNA helicase
MEKTTRTKRPSPGEVARVRTRTYLVQSVTPSPNGTHVQMACLDDDAQGHPLDIVWELELDTEILNEEAWKSIGNRGFDPPRQFSAYIHALRWNCVTATNPRLFQAPFRAGIRIEPYQLEPLRKALILPRVNLFIADDVGLGKTIEAGLIASELLMRRRVNDIVVACPPSMLPQWKDELDSRFGLTFETLDHDYVERIREERGYSVNPWTTFPRFIVSHRLLIDETYAAPLRDWLDNLRPGSLLILDEAHHAAPSSGTKYAIDSRITRAIRDLAPRFEHRLFLSATPHNGHSNSFSALLEILDPNRFTRGVKVVKTNLDDAMVRRLKEDVREVAGGFPTRNVEQIDIDGLPKDAPELVLSHLLNEYRDVRQKRMEGVTKRKQAEAALLISGLQQRLLSSVEAFARTLKVHKRTMEKYWEKHAEQPPKETRSAKQLALLSGEIDGDDERAELAEEELQVIEDAQFEASTTATAEGGDRTSIDREKKLLDHMDAVAEQARGVQDARVRHLIKWIQDNMCRGVYLPGEHPTNGDASWNGLRVLIFTEYEDTKRYLVNMLRAAVCGTHLAEHRIEVFHGPTPPDKREQIKRAFNAPPDKHPVRILIATDAAREGLNLQAHCWNLFHFDVPWNPSRLEQRNGRIDRKLQSSPVVNCYYFVYAQRPEDRVLKALVRKTKIIREELGSLSQVLESRLAETLRGGIRHDLADRIAEDIDKADLDPEKRRTTEEELEQARQRQEQLKEQVTVLQRRVDDARKWIGLDTEFLRAALSCSLEMLGAEPLQPTKKPDDPEEPDRFIFPSLATRLGSDPTWATTLDTLRTLPEDGQKDFQWRREAPIRPVVFGAPKGVDDSVVQLHLHHRIVQRLLGRFLAQGFVHHDLSRACLVQSRDNVPRVVMLGRLSLYGIGAVRLHEEILSVTARWSASPSRNETLRPYAREAEAKTLELLESALAPGSKHSLAQEVQEQLLHAIPTDVEQLLPHLQQRGEAARADAEKALVERGETEAANMQRILEDQKKRILTELGKNVDRQLSLFDFEEERRQYESNRRYWERWIENVDDNLVTEPARIRGFYKVGSHRIEPVGLAYLLPGSE